MYFISVGLLLLLDLQNENALTLYARTSSHALLTWNRTEHYHHICHL